MYMKTFNHSIDNCTLKAIEELWGYNLPKDYRSFLMQYNGGEPFKKLFRFKKNNETSRLNEFFGFLKDFNKNLLFKQKYSGLRVPNNMLPIAREVFGNLILLAVKNHDRGKIYFWDHEMEADEGQEPDYSNLTLIADSFDEFINNLHSEDEMPGS